ncbi:hypothetical protein M404DRAFT_774413 [Pisolithus tinctorius Marx 270]|uniref:Uncharacterized protein n=1 Tax=Pisolithus tinctorius Marx 270 TaxID=870435 RepID=A0A0C3NX23_PISTI|nr:hypothetical protein M404DRAFT_774413 [Pisolithus tinctorius Marx 270]
MPFHVPLLQVVVSDSALRSNLGVLMSWNITPDHHGHGRQTVPSEYLPQKPLPEHLYILGETLLTGWDLQSAYYHGTTSGRSGVIPLPPSAGI